MLKSNKLFIKKILHKTRRSHGHMTSKLKPWTIKWNLFNLVTFILKFDI